MKAWKLETAKARFSELVRQAAEAGPQVITVRGREAAVVMSAEAFRRLSGEDDGNWVDRLRAIGPIDVELERDTSTFRDLDL